MLTQILPFHKYEAKISFVYGPFCVHSSADEAKLKLKNQNKKVRKRNIFFVSFIFWHPNDYYLILIAQRQIKPNSTNIVRLYSESQWWKIEILTSVVISLKVKSENSSVAGRPWSKLVDFLFNNYFQLCTFLQPVSTYRVTALKPDTNFSI